MKSPFAISSIFLALVACGGGDDKDGPRNNIHLTLGAEALETSVGTAVYLPVTVERAAGLGDVVLLVEGPEGVGAAEVILPVGQDSVVLEVGVAEDTEVASAVVTVTATADGGDGSATLPIDVRPYAPSSLELIGAALDGGAIDYETSLLYRGYAMVGDERLPVAYRGTSMGEDLAFFREARSSELSPATQTALAPFLVRPIDPASIYNTLEATNPSGLTAQTSNCTESDPGQIVVNGYKTKRAAVPMRVWVKCSGDEAVDDVILDSAVSHANDFYTKMTTDFGVPVFDGDDVGTTGNLDDCIDLYIVPDGTASLRGTQTHSARGITVDTKPYAGNTSSGYILIGRGRALSSGLKSTYAHEFFHVLQNAYNMTFMFERAGAGRPWIEFWWVEASATWASTQYVPSLAFDVYNERFPGFQRSRKSMHQSYSTSSADSHLMYASFIWGHFMQHQTGGVGVIKQSWDALKPISGHEAATNALDGVFKYKDNFPDFAVANVNENLPDALPLAKRHKGLRQDRFPEPRPKPNYSADERLDAVVNKLVTVEVAPLRAQYFRYAIADNIKKVVIHFDTITQDDGLEIRTLEDMKDAPWKLENHTGKDKQTYCIDRPGEELEELIVVLSNVTVLPFEKFVLGAMRIETFELPCAARWTGTLSRTTTTTVPGLTSTEIRTATVSLEQDTESLLTLFRPTGSFTYSREGTLVDCELRVDTYNGTFNKDPFQGVLILHPDTDPIQFESTVVTGPFQVVQHVICPNPDSSFDTTLPLDEDIFVIFRQDGYTVSEDGKTLSGTKVETFPNGSDTHTWELTRED
ncbi:MAG: hypothetical protein ACAI38_22375 [Myxococcota bacterium]